MIDRRLRPANARVALSGFASEGQRETDGELHTVTAPLLDLRDAPEGKRDRQLLFGDAFLVLETEGLWSFGVSQKDGYVGYVKQEGLDTYWTPSHRVQASHIYPQADMKSEALMALSFGSEIDVLETQGSFVRIAAGYVPAQHILPPQTDPAAVAERFLGTPYVWGGNSSFGIDCSGLVQMALLCCGFECPGDSDQQTALGEDAEGYERNDLLFWEGHVALCVDDTTLIHANAHHMAVAYEGISEAISRIKAQGGGPVMAHRRL